MFPHFNSLKPCKITLPEMLQCFSNLLVFTNTNQGRCQMSFVSLFKGICAAEKSFNFHNDNTRYAIRPQHFRFVQMYSQNSLQVTLL